MSQSLDVPHRGLPSHFNRRDQLGSRISERIKGLVRPVRKERKYPHWRVIESAYRPNTRCDQPGCRLDVRELEGRAVAFEFRGLSATPCG
jgi:hypothetical protein